MGVRTLPFLTSGRGSVFPGLSMGVGVFSLLITGCGSVYPFNSLGVGGFFLVNQLAWECFPG